MKNTILYLIAAILFCTSCAVHKNMQEIQVEPLVKSVTSWDGRPLPSYGEGTPEVTVLRITVPPGQRLKVHKHLCINVGLLMKGELTVMTETNDSLRLKAGDSIVELVDTWHYGMNTGRKPAEIVVFYAGIEGVPITVPKGE